MAQEHIIAAPASTDLSELLRNADVIIQNSSLYLKSKHLEVFRDLVATIRQKQDGFVEPLKSHCSEVPDETADPNSHAWEHVEQATKLVEEEAIRIGKVRLAADFKMLVCCFKSGFSGSIFPSDLTVCLQDVIDSVQPHETLQNLVGSLHKALKQGSGSDVLEDLLKSISTELANSQVIGSGRKRKISLMHRAAFAGQDSLLAALMKMTGKVSDINALDSDGQTPLHFATIAGQTNAARVLLGNEKLRPNEEDRRNQTSLQIAVETKKKDIEKLLLERSDVQQYVDRLSADRQVYVDAINSILVGSSLIASVTFGGWLSPPLGFVQYYNYPSAFPAPPDQFDSYAAVGSSLSVRVFYALNSLSFFSSVATVIAGAGSVLPMPEAFIKHQVRTARKSVVLTSTLLVISIVFVLGAFAAAGFASLPPNIKYTANISVTVVVGSILCVVLLGWFLSRLYLIRPIWWRRMEDNLYLFHARSSAHVERNTYLLS